MRTLTRVVPALVAASLLAACSGNGGGSSIPSSGNLNSFVVTGANTARGDAPQLITFMPMNDMLPNVPGGRAVERHRGAAGNLLYGGGPIQAAPKLYVVFWGSAWSGSGDPDGMMTRYTDFLSHVGGTSWNASVTQYTMTGGVHAGNPANNFGGSYIDTTSSPPNTPSQSQMAAEAVKAAAHFNDYSVGAQYIVAMPTGVSPSGFKTSYCAYHSSTTANGATISWTNMPYLPDAGTGCGAGSVTGSNLDGVSIVGGHEMAESETDPQPNSGWVDSAGGENGDKCAWTNLQNTNLNGTSYPTQPLWSNAANGGAGGCVQSYP